MRKSLQGIITAGLMSLGLISASSNTANAQDPYYWGNPHITYIEKRGFSLGVNMGMADMWGDVGTYQFYDKYINKTFTDDIIKNLRGMGGMYVRYTHNPGLSFRLGINYGKVYATDQWNVDKALEAKSITDDAYQRYTRNLDANTSIWEGNFMVEFSPLRYFSDWEFGRMAKMRFQPYLLLGVSGFQFNPKGTLTDLETGSEKWVDLRPLRTEGQGFSGTNTNYGPTYSVFSYAALGGIGVKWDLGRGLALGLEYQLRFTFTDYLDDVSKNYVSPVHAATALDAYQNKLDLHNRMADKSKEIIPGYENPIGKQRGDDSDTDKFSTLSLTFMWKVDWKEIGWWNKRK